MLRRLLLALLSLCLAVPAMAMPLGMDRAPMPHETMAMAGHGHHGSHHSIPNGDRGDHAGKHECIGCAVSDTPVARLAAEWRPTPQLVRPALAQRLGDARAGPEVPPPRV